MAITADVVINLPARSVNRPFTYLVPDELDYLTPGWRVTVPFGSRKAEGFVVKVGAGDGEGLKAVLAVLDDEPWFTGHMLELADWLAGHYLCTPAEAMRLFIPGKAGVKSVTAYRADPETRGAAEEYLQTCPEIYRRVYRVLEVGGPKTARQLTAEYGREVVNVLRRLVKGRLLLAESVARRTAGPKFERRWRLAASRDEAAASLAALRGKKAQARMLEALLAHEALNPELMRRLKLSAATANALAEKGLAVAENVRVHRDSYTGPAAAEKAVELTSAQRAALAAVVPLLSARRAGTFLLHGVTGSGKTQVYIEAAAEARRLGRQVVVLVPEIALTGQIVARFKARFGEDVLVLHSKLSVGERYDTWQRLRAGEAGIVIGARSAVFAPLADPGLFVIDEEQEFTYKQEESPRYHTREVAVKRAQLAGAAVLLGSATPSLETYYAAQNGEYQLLEMTERVDNAQLPAVTVVDMREELRAGRRGVISLPLRELLAAALEKGEQAIILLNRRGYATFVLCRECGQVLSCDRCAVSLVYHSAGGALRCHYCGVCQQTPDVCPACGSRYIRYFGTGTQRVEEELAGLFPDARLVRMDQDTTGGKLAHDRILGAFAAGRYDILLGTQMVAKGHDIANVTAVGVISADTALNLPDFRAAEKTFMLLTQAAGRAGRGKKAGRVVVQTYNPEHYAVQTGAHHDYAAFYQQEIGCRRELDYPPFTGMVKLTVLGGDESKARRRAEETAAALRSRGDGDAVTVIGPFPAPVAKISDVFRMHILLKGDGAAARTLLKELELQWRSDIVVDIDPLNIM